MTNEPNSSQSELDEAIEEAWLEYERWSPAGKREKVLLPKDFLGAVETLLASKGVRQSIIESLTKEELDQVLVKYFIGSEYCADEDVYLSPGDSCCLTPENHEFYYVLKPNEVK